MHTKLKLIIIILLIIIGLVVLDNNTTKTTEVVDVEKHQIPERATMSGEVLCLGETGDSVYGIDGCVRGIMLDNGDLYGIDFMLMSQSMVAPEPGVRITASGVVVPVERLSVDFWRNIGVKGIFSVTDSVIVE